MRDVFDPLPAFGTVDEGDLTSTDCDVLTALMKLNAEDRMDLREISWVDQVADLTSLTPEETLVSINRLYGAYVIGTALPFEDKAHSIDVMLKEQDKVVGLFILACCIGAALLIAAPHFS